jgi:hypothetical protein
LNGPGRRWEINMDKQKKTAAELEEMMKVRMGAGVV